MAEEIETFFTQETNAEQLSLLLKGLAKIDSEDSELKFVISNLKTIIHFMVNDGDFFNKHCQFNIEWIGSAFISEIQRFNHPAKDDVKADLINRTPEIFTSAYRFLCEASFNNPGSLNRDLERIKIEIEDNLEVFNKGDRSQLVYANYLMPAEIVKKLINHPQYPEIKSFNEKVDNLSKLESDWNESFNTKVERIDKLKTKLAEYETGFNFVGIYKGFEDLSKVKRNEKNWALAFLITLALLALAPVLTEIYLFLFKTAIIQTNLDIVKYSIIPMITIQLILVYFFRVALLNYKSIKAQLLQIELRKTLCQFIQSYASYAKDIKESDKTSLEKFENLIFSGLIANEENLPSTFDGLDQIGKIVQSMKS